MNDLVGIYYILYCVPMWALSLILIFLCIGILFIIRDWFEKLPYNISVASQQGDLALVGIILMATEVLKKQAVFDTVASGFFIQLILFVSSVGIGIELQFYVVWHDKKWGTIADTYHNLFIVPFLVFLLLTTVPVFYSYAGFIEKWLAFFLFLFWFGTVVFDARQGRLQQPKWLAKHGIYVPIKRAKKIK